MAIAADSDDLEHSIVKAEQARPSRFLLVVDSGKEYAVTATASGASFTRYDSAMRSSLLSSSLEPPRVDSQLIVNIFTGIVGSAMTNGLVIGIMILFWEADSRRSRAGMGAQGWIS